VVYGPRDRDTLLVFRAARFGVVPRLGPLAWLSIVHVDDLVRGTRCAGEHPRAANRTYFLANAEPSTLPELAAPIAAVFGRRPIQVPLPAPPMYAAALAAELAAAATGRVTPITRNKVREAFRREWVCDASRAAEELGWRAAIPVVDGVRTTAEWYRREGWL